MLRHRRRLHPHTIIRRPPGLLWSSRSSLRAPPITRLAPLPPIHPPHRLCPLRSRPRPSVPLNPDISLASTLPLPSLLARPSQLTHPSPLCAMVRPSIVKRLMSTCSAPQSPQGSLTLIASSTILRRWCPLTGVTSAMTVVSFYCPTGWAGSPVPFFSDASVLRADQPLCYRSHKVFNYPRHLSTPWVGSGAIQRLGTGIFDSLRRVSVFVPRIALPLAPAVSYRVVEQRQQLVAISHIIRRRESTPSATSLVRLTDISTSTNTPPTTRRCHATNDSIPRNPCWICATPMPTPCLAHMTNRKCTTGPPFSRLLMAPRTCVPANHHSRRSCRCRRHI